VSLAFDKSVISDTQTLRDALLSLEASSVQVVFVADADGRVAGLLTDGDVRRAILHSATLDAPASTFMNRRFAAVAPATNRAHVLDLMRSRRVSEVPILDAEGRLVGLHRLQDIVRHETRPNWAVVMAGGRGTRLAPLTQQVTKPMIRVAGRPILERIVLHLVGHGIENIFLAINYLGEQVESHFEDGEKFGCNVRYLREKEPLGTGGALSLLPSTPTTSTLVMNGDLLTEADLGGMLEAHESSKAVATVGVRRYFHNVPFGCVDLQGDRIISMEEKPTLARTINAGIYVLSPEMIARVPREEFPLTRLIEGAIARGEHVCAHEVREDWIDVGQRDQLKQARGEME
jgi:dTDP-glucose pyrophosphorylase